MADVLFYSTGEIFWVTDPPSNRPHIRVSPVMPAVPPDHLFTYARCAHTLADAGHNIIGAFGRHRLSVRNKKSKSKIDPEFLALGSIPNPENTVLVLIATDTGTPEEGGVDHFSRNPFTDEEKEAFDKFRSKGGGVYICWDHGPLGWKSLEELGLTDPIEYPGDFKPNVVNSYDSTDSGEIIREVQKLENGKWVKSKEAISVGPPAGYLQKIIPATSIGPETNDPATTPMPHEIFNGVGDVDGIWIPAHMHEGRLKVDAHIARGIINNEMGAGITPLAVHVPFTDTIFQSFVLMAIKDSEWKGDGQDAVIKQGRLLWDTSFHHLVDINWSSDGLVPWEPYTPFSVQGLWRQQLPPELFEKRLDAGIKRLFPNAIKWLSHGGLGSPSQQVTNDVTFKNVKVDGFQAMDMTPRNDA